MGDLPFYGSGYAYYNTAKDFCQVFSRAPSLSECCSVCDGVSDYRLGVLLLQNDIQKVLCFVTFRVIIVAWIGGLAFSHQERREINMTYLEITNYFAQLNFQTRQANTIFGHGAYGIIVTTESGRGLWIYEDEFTSGDYQVDVLSGTFEEVEVNCFSDIEAALDFIVNY